MGRTIAERREWENDSNVVAEPQGCWYSSEWICKLSIRYFIFKNLQTTYYYINIDTQSDPAAQES